MRNKIKAFVDSREITVYRFRADTGLSQGTAYRLYNNPDEIPRSDVLEKICSRYLIQPGEILEWLPGEDCNAS